MARFLSRLLRRSVDVSRYLEMIEQDDPLVIEQARGHVTPAEVDALLDRYWALPTWQQKRAVIDLVQDHTRSRTAEVMVDFLRAPMAGGDEWTELAKAAALGHLGEEYDEFMVYYHDRQRLRVDVAAVLAERGTTVETAPTPHSTRPVAVPDGGTPNDRLLAAAAAGDLATVRRAVADGASIDARVSAGSYADCSALVRAMMNKRWDVAEWLIDAGADVNARRPVSDDRSKGQTALWWAAAHGDIAITERLLAAGADHRIPDTHDSTPVLQAASSGNLAVLRLLAARGAGLHDQISDGRRPLNLAVQNGHTDVVGYLLEAGAEVDHRGSSGYTPLMLACEQGPFSIVALLVEHGADVNAVHPGPGIYSAMEGMTPLAFAVQGGYIKATQTLLAAGGDRDYVVPGATRWDGKQIPERRMADLAVGKRADRIKEILRTR